MFGYGFADSSCASCYQYFHMLLRIHERYS
jgi:hypothetical protein